MNYVDLTFRENEQAPFLGIFTHTEPVFTMDEQIASLRNLVKKNPLISGIGLRIPWHRFHPEEDVVYWDKLEALLDTAVSHNLLVHFALIPGVHTPDWAFEKGITKVGPVTIGGTQHHTPLLWDPTYVRILTEELAAFAQRYADDRRIVSMSIMGHNYKGEEMHAPIQTELLSGLSLEIVVSSWEYWIDLYGSLFPNKKLAIVVSQMYPGESNMPEQVTKYHVKKHQGRAVLHTHQLNGRSAKRILSADICAKFHSLAPHGHEMVGSFKEQPDRQGSPEMTVYNAVRLGNPLFLQLWRRDCDDPRYAEKLLEAWETYAHLHPNTIAERLKENGLFVEVDNYVPPIRAQRTTEVTR